jgi:hypothetical protein
MSDLDLCEQPQATQQSVLNRSGKDKFLLVLNLPQILKKDKNVKIDSLQISVFGTIVPSVQVPSTEVRFGGQVINVSSHARPNYPPLPVNFIVDNDFENYWILWKWLNVLNTARSSVYDGTDPELLTTDENTLNGVLWEYQANFSVYGLNEYNQKVIEFKYYNAFITNLGNIDYNYRDPELISTTAEFQFNQLDIKLIKK